MSQVTSGIFNFQIQSNSTIRWFCSDCHIDRQFVFFKNMERSDGKYVINSIEEEISGEFKMSNTQCEDSKCHLRGNYFDFVGQGMSHDRDLKKTILPLLSSFDLF